MALYRYENHILDTQQLPFIFHPLFTQTRRSNRPNWHENIELLHCLEGSGYIQCGGAQTPFVPGDTYIVNANMLHCIGSEISVSYQCLIIDNSFFAENSIPVPDIRFQSTVHDDAVTEKFREITEAYGQITATGSRDLFAVAEVRYTILGLLRILCRQYADPKPVRADSDGSRYVKEAIRYIRQNIASPITLEDIARHTGVSKFHLMREFKTYTGATVINTVNLIRCTEARQQIEQGESVSTAAISCGYHNLSYFTRTFRKYMGVLPSQLLPGKK